MALAGRRLDAASNSSSNAPRMSWTLIKFPGDSTAHVLAAICAEIQSHVGIVPLRGKQRLCHNLPVLDARAGQAWQGPAL